MAEGKSEAILEIERAANFFDPTPLPPGGLYNVSVAPPGGNETASRDEGLARVEIILQGVIFALAVFGNGLVLAILFFRLKGKKLSRMNTMIMHLSIADLFVAFFNILPQLIWDITYRFNGSDSLCKFVKYFQVVAMYASSYVLVSTALDRYLVICHPLSSQTWTPRYTHALVATAWIFSLLFSIPQIFIFALREISPGSMTYDCWAEFEGSTWGVKTYITWFTAALLVVPFILLSICYGRICQVVWKSMRNREHSVRVVQGNTNAGMSWKARGLKSRAPVGQSHESERQSLNGNPSKNQSNQNGRPAPAAPSGNSAPRAHVQGLSRAKVKTIKLTLTVILCYFICWAPFFIAQLWSVWDPNAPVNSTSFVILLLLASLNSCTNPWIYLAFSDTLYRQVVRCCCPAQRHLGLSGGRSDFDSRVRSTFRSTTTTDVTTMPLNERSPLPYSIIKDQQ